MAIIYSGTTDPDIVNKGELTVTEIDLAVYVNRYLTLRNQYLSLPETKSTPDAETLAFYNAVITSQNEVETAWIKEQATELYIDLQPIYEAGLLPAEYEDEYQQLENFINS